ncbi:MAG: ATP-dependent 6-phosphofructokinase [Christensenellales bacterium]
MERIAVITSGGDSQGMNTCLYNLVKCALINKIEIIGFMRGYQGLIDNDYVKMDFEFVKNVNNLGGSCLKTARSKEFMTDEGKQKVVQNLKALNIDTLICIGGDGSFRGCLELIKLGIKCIGIPGTIDNDLNYTNKTLGFDTAVNNATEAISNIMETMRANNRLCIVEVMGRRCGDIALTCAVASHADIALIPEVPFTFDSVLKQVKEIIAKGNKHPTIVIAENQIDLNEFATFIQQNVELEVKSCVLGYIQRGGKPTVEDRLLGMQFAVYAIKCVLDKIYNVAIGIVDNNIITTPISDAIEAKSDFNFELYSLYKMLNE